MRRAFEWSLALACLVAFAPLMALMTVVIKISSPGPIIFSQTRVGKDGRRFQLYKFRTMVDKADQLGTSVTTESDPRITQVGRFLRRLKLDELPQLWNVLRGDMGIVGPRPDVPGFADQLTGDDRVILSVRPGLTGPATLMFRDEERILSYVSDPDEFNRIVIFPEKLRINRDYVENRSLLRDLRYLIETMVSMVRRPPREPEVRAQVGAFKVARDSLRTDTGLAGPERIHLSPPHLSGREQTHLMDVLTSNWVAPVGPQLEKFEERMTEFVGVRHGLAVSSGTAALHLALRALGIAPGEEVICATLTFCASANPIVYQGARPVFIDSDEGWNLDPNLLSDELAQCAAKRKLPRAIIVVDLFGKSADMDAIVDIASRYEIPVIEDAAEALGATYKDRLAGASGWASVFSFNGNKIITTGGGGMLCSNDSELIERARYLATQARDPAPHYQHSTVGYNYRMSNVLAAIGLAQLDVINQRVEQRRAIFNFYRRHLNRQPGITFMPESPYGCSNRWLTAIQVDPLICGTTCEELRLRLAHQNIESRPVWKPLHLQPSFSGCRYRGQGIAERIFRNGICLPSGSAMAETDLMRVVDVIQSAATSQQSARQVHRKQAA